MLQRGDTSHIRRTMSDPLFYTPFETHHHTLPGGLRLAHRFTPGKGPALVFLPGYMSDMAGSKAQAVFDWAVLYGHACLLLDYSGCGESDGSFAEGTLSRWRDEVLALVEAHCPQSAGLPVVFVGSSMGGWLMLLCALALPPERRAGLIGVAPAPDFTRWGYSEEDRARLARGEIVYEDNAYGPDPTPTYPGLWADGEQPPAAGPQDRARNARCGCCTGRPIPTCRGKSRCGSPIGCVQPTCRSC